MRNCRLEGARLVAEPGIVLSFQRYLTPEGGVFDRAPPSLGQLPLGLGSGGDPYLPLTRDECCWIGLSVIPGAEDASLSILAVQAGAEFDILSGKRQADTALRIGASDRRRIDGILRSEGRFIPIIREANRLKIPGVSLLRCFAFAAGEANARSEAAIRLVDYQTFSIETGLDPPGSPDPDAGYKGWLLP
jgi:hypothetical protein